jgi:hypothetical protein
MIDSIVWGNPTQRNVAELEKKTIIDELFEVFSDMSYPKNSSIAVKQELNQLVDYVSDLKNNDNYLDRYRYYDYGVERLFNKISEQQNIDKELINIAVDEYISQNYQKLLKPYIVQKDGSNKKKYTDSSARELVKKNIINSYF